MGLSSPVRPSCRCRVSPGPQNRRGPLCGPGALLLAGRGSWAGADTSHPHWSSLPAGAWCSEGSGAGGPLLGSRHLPGPGEAVLGGNLQHLMRTRLCPGGKPNHLFSLSVLWSWKENPVYLPRFTKTLRSRDAHKVCTELKLPSFNSLIRLFIQQVSVKYPPWVLVLVLCAGTQLQTGWTVTEPMENLHLNGEVVHKQSNK